MILFSGFNMTNKYLDSSNLSTSRQEMYNALTLFYSHVKHTLSLLITIITAVFAILAFVLKEKINSLNPELMPVIQQMGGSILFIVFVLSLISIVVIWRYYKLYVAALVFSSKQHIKANMSEHIWFIEVIEKEKELTNKYPILTEEQILKKLVFNRSISFPHSFILYAFILLIIGLVGLFSGYKLINI
jgi:hypothetical protein